ncbi:MAG: hypothetical protein J3R72DRAFT_487161 [Linnemannia gamsii]|nr:MAG: hypothetical protein J3R72DRAFT_487161 [Linnemannia gamsii]
MMKMFLRDCQSVDVQFLIFLTDGELQHGPKNNACRPLPGLWAHRIVMSRYPAFAALIHEATSATQVCQTEPLTIPVYGFSLAALSCLMYFLYTGNVQLLTYPDYFVLSEVEADAVVVKHECLSIEPDTVMIDPQYMTDIYPPQAPTMPNADLYEEMILHITGKPLGTSYQSSTVTISETISTAVYNNSRWDVVLTRDNRT